MPALPKRSPVVTLRRDINAEYLALSKITREALAIQATRLLEVEDHLHRAECFVVGVLGMVLVALPFLT